MKKTKLTRSLLAACSIVALSAVMYGCVHGGGGDGPVATDVTLSGAQMGQTLEAGTYQPDDALTAAIEGASEAALEAAAGEHATGDMITVAGLDFSCVSGPCSVTVNDNGTVTTMGTIKVMEHMVAMPDPPDPPDPAIAQQAAISTAIATATTAVTGLTAASSTTNLTAAANAVAAVRTAIAAGSDVHADQIAAYNTAATVLEGSLASSRTAINARIAGEQKTANAAMLADAKSLLGAFGRDPAATAPTIDSVSASSGGTYKVTLDTAVGKFDSAAAPDTVAGHHGAMLTYDDEAMVVYSSISNADAKGGRRSF